MPGMRNPPASPFWVLGLQSCATTPASRLVSEPSLPSSSSSSSSSYSSCSLLLIVVIDSLTEFRTELETLTGCVSKCISRQAQHPECEQRCHMGWGPESVKEDIDLGTSI